MPEPSLRAERSNPEDRRTLIVALDGLVASPDGLAGLLDCFVANAPRNDGAFIGDNS